MADFSVVSCMYLLSTCRREMTAPTPQRVSIFAKNVTGVIDTSEMIHQHCARALCGTGAGRRGAARAGAARAPRHTHHLSGTVDFRRWRTQFPHSDSMRHVGIDFWALLDSSCQGNERQVRLRVNSTVGLDRLMTVRPTVSAHM